MDEEGDIADGPQGPIIFSGGRWVPMGAPRGPIPIGPRNNRQVVQQDNEAARLELARQAAARAADAAREASSARGDASRNAQIKIDMDLATKGLMIGPGGQIVPRPGGAIGVHNDGSSAKVTAKVREDAIQGYNDAASLERIADQLQAQFDAGPGATSGIAGLQDYLPLSENKVMNDTSFQARGYVKRGLGFTGGEGNTVGEIGLNYGPYLPEASDRDDQIVNKIAALRTLAGDARKKSVAVLGGVPDVNGVVTPLQQQNPFNQESAQGVQRAEGSVADALTRNQRFRTEDNPEVANFAFDMFRKGSSINDINEALQTKFPGSQQIIMRPDTFKYAKENPGWNPFTATRQVPLTTREKFSGSDTGAFLANLGNAGSLGAVGAIAPDELAMMRSASPKSSLVGEVGGSIFGAGALGRIGAGVGKELAPQLTQKVLGSGGLARGLALETGYGGARGAIEDGDPFMGAGLGMLGGAGGGILGEGVGRVFSGVTSSPSAQFLRQQGVTPTLGQIMRGRAADNGGQSLVAGLEDTVANTPLAGTLVNTRRGDALDQANTAAYRTVGGPQITGTGQEAIDQLGLAKNQAYTDFAQGVLLPTNEPKFVDQVAGINPGLGADQFGRFMDTTINPALNQTPEIGGRRLQEMFQTLARNKSLARKDLTDTMANSATADAIQGVENALTGLAARNAPWAVPKLKEANKLNRGFSILDEAAGSAQGEPGQVFTGAQLGQSLRNDASRFSGGRGLSKISKSDLSQLQRAMTATLPNKVPPTGVNTAPALAAAGLATGFAGERTDNDMLMGLGALGLLATPYTKRGANLTAKVLLDRPEKVRDAGKALRKKKGLFGSAGSGLLRDYDKKAENKREQKD